MKKAFILLAHPEPKSFNAALARRARETFEDMGCEVVVSDLCAMGFDPVSDRRNFTTVKDPDYFKQQVEEMRASEADGFAPDVRAEMEKIEACDAFVMQFPLWWFGMPAIMKGWVDRVFAMGRVYGGGRWFDKGAFAGKRAMVSTTTGGGDAMFGPDSIYGDIGAALHPINRGVLSFTGFDALPPLVCHAPARIGDEGRAAHLDLMERRVRDFWNTEPLAYPKLDDYEKFRLKRPAS